MPLTLYEYKKNGQSFLHNTMQFFRNFLFAGSNFYSWQLWYLLSMIFMLSIIGGLIHSKVKLKNIYMISFVVFLMAKMMDVLLEKNDSLPNCLLMVLKLYKYIFVSGRLFTGMIFIVTGMCIARMKTERNRFALCFLVITGVLGKCIFPAILQDLALLIAVTAVFILIKSIHLPDSKIYYYFRRISAIIYLVHMMCFFLYSLLFRNIGSYGLDAFVITTISSVLISIVVLLLENKIKFIRFMF